MSEYIAPDLATAALITIDTQRDTLDGQPFEIPGTSGIVPRMGALLRIFRQGRKPIVHIVRTYKPDGSNVDLCRRALVERGAKLLLAGSQGSQLARELLPNERVRLQGDLLLASGIQRIGDQEVIMYKPRWGAFYRTPLEDHLRAAGVSTVIFTGCNFPNCPRASIYEASERDFRIILVEDAVSGLYDRGKEEMRGIGVQLMTTDEILESLERGPEPQVPGTHPVNSRKPREENRTVSPGHMPGTESV